MIMAPPRERVSCVCAGLTVMSSGAPMIEVDDTSTHELESCDWKSKPIELRERARERERERARLLDSCNWKSKPVELSDHCSWKSDIEAR